AGYVGRDGTVAGQLCRLVVEAEERRPGDRDLKVRVLAPGGGESAPQQARPRATGCAPGTVLRGRARRLWGLGLSAFATGRDEVVGVQRCLARVAHGVEDRRERVGPALVEAAGVVLAGCASERV